jgi:uncharacterized protein YuzE
MTKPKFRLEISFNETGEPVAGYLRLREGEVARTKEVTDGLVFADYAADGSLLGIELLGPCDVAILDRLAEHEPEAIRRFLRDGVRRQLVVA